MNMKYGINEYKKYIIDEIARLNNHLDEINSLFKSKYCIESLVAQIEDPYSESVERDRLEWCYDNDIPCKISVFKASDNFRESMPDKQWRVFEFKNKADMVAFKLKWNDSKSM